MVILPHRASIPLNDPNQFAIVAFDPGGTVGWASLTIDVRAFSRPERKVLPRILSWDCGEFSGAEEEQLKSAVGLMWRTRQGGEFIRRTDVIGEDFELTQLIGSSENLLSPVRINAVLDWEARKLGLVYQRQKRHMRVKETGERLNLYGFQGKWRERGAGKDQFAAMQHAVVWMRRVKKLSQARPWKLSDGVSGNAYWDCACSDDRDPTGPPVSVCDLSHPR